MDIGLLWYDDSKADFATKVEEASQRYEEKFGKRPNRCYVNPASLPAGGDSYSLDGITVLSRPGILPDHFWVGVARTKGPHK